MACCAALAAFESGANVAVIEAAPKEGRGGNSRFSDTVFRFPHPYFVRLDWPMPTVVLKKSQGKHDRAEMDTIIEQGYDTVKWMREHGVWTWHPAFLS